MIRARGEPPRLEEPSVFDVPPGSASDADEDLIEQALTELGFVSREVTALAARDDDSAERWRWDSRLCGKSGTTNARRIWLVGARRSMKDAA